MVPMRPAPLTPQGTAVLHAAPAPAPAPGALSAALSQLSAASPPPAEPVSSASPAAATPAAAEDLQSHAAQVQRDLERSDAIFERLDAKVRVARRDLLDLWEQTRVQSATGDGVGASEQLMDEFGRTVSDAVSQAYGRAISQTGEDIDQSIQQLQVRFAGHDAAAAERATATSQILRPDSDPVQDLRRSVIEKRREEFTMAVVQAKIEHMLDALIEDVVTEYRARSGYKDSDEWVTDLQGELAKHRTHASKLKLQLSEVMERLRRHDVKMDILRGHLLRRNKLLEDQRTAYYKEITILREQIFQKRRWADEFDPDDWGRFFDMDLLTRQANALDALEPADETATAGPSSPRRRMAQTRAARQDQVEMQKSVLAKLRRDFDKERKAMLDSHQVELSVMREEIRLLEEKLTTKEEEMLTALDSGEDAIKVRIDQLQSQHRQELHLREIDHEDAKRALAQQIEVREKARYEQLMGDKVRNQKEFYEREIKEISDDFRQEIRTHTETIKTRDSKIEADRKLIKSLESSLTERDEQTADLKSRIESLRRRKEDALKSGDMAARMDELQAELELKASQLNRVEIQYRETVTQMMDLKAALHEAKEANKKLAQSAPVADSAAADHRAAAIRSEYTAQLEVATREREQASMALEDLLSRLAVQSGAATKHSAELEDRNKILEAARDVLYEQVDNLKSQVRSLQEAEQARPRTDSVDDPAYFSGGRFSFYRRRKSLPTSMERSLASNTPPVIDSPIATVGIQTEPYQRGMVQSNASTSVTGMIGIRSVGTETPAAPPQTVRVISSGISRQAAAAASRPDVSDSPIPEPDEEPADAPPVPPLALDGMDAAPAPATASAVAAGIQTSPRLEAEYLDHLERHGGTMSPGHDGVAAAVPMEIDDPAWVDERQALVARVAELEALLIEARQNRTSTEGTQAGASALRALATTADDMSRPQLVMLEEAVQVDLELQQEEAVAKWELLTAGLQQKKLLHRAQQTMTYVERQQDEISKMSVFKRLQIRADVLVRKHRERCEAIKKERRENMERVLGALYLLVRPEHARARRASVQKEIHYVTLRYQGPTRPKSARAARREPVWDRGEPTFRHVRTPRLGGPSTTPRPPQRPQSAGPVRVGAVAGTAIAGTGAARGEYIVAEEHHEIGRDGQLVRPATAPAQRERTDSIDNFRASQNAFVAATSYPGHAKRGGGFTADVQREPVPAAPTVSAGPKSDPTPPPGTPRHVSRRVVSRPFSARKRPAKAASPRSVAGMTTSREFWSLSREQRRDAMLRMIYREPRVRQQSAPLNGRLIVEDREEP